MSREFIDFVNAYQDEDTARLLLSAARYPDIDMPAAVQQIEGRRTAREKWPSLLQCEEFLYPPRLNREQASSEATAEWKSDRAAAWKSGRVADLTGGMGIDTLAFAHVATHVDYVERDPQLCSLMEHNLKALGIDNVDVHCADSMEWLSTAGHYDMLFVDPARRDSHGRKVAGFEDCTPNILEHMPLLRSHSRRLMVKASPMIDIDMACRQLDGVEEVHVVEFGGECKEVLFVCGEPQDEPRICCGSHRFTRSEEAAAEVSLCESVGRYLYEPDAALMKAGPFRSISGWYGVAMLGRNTHLYTSDSLVDGFPGRCFEVLQELKLDRKAVADAIPDGKAHVVTRNYPVAAADLQRQLGLKEGGEVFVIATTVGIRRSGFLCIRK
ncbi:MAG: hypothetical protein IKP83_02710 [Bacteroidales bacterium]|nr:hypothetical protein [Bacteroidales bacterium]